MADVEEFEVSASFDDGFDAGACDADAAADGKMAELEKVEGDAAEGSVGDGGAAEGEVEMGEHGEAEGEDFGCCVGESTAEGLVDVMLAGVSLR